MEKHASIEKEILSRFKKAWPGFPKGELVKSESPDFILKCGHKKTIGIEVTRIDEPSFRKHPEIITAGLTGKSEIEESIITITKDQISSTIQRKEEKLPLYYKQMSDTYWLIITAGMESNNRNFRISQNAVYWQFKTAFHKLFLILLPKAKVFEFK